MSRLGAYATQQETDTEIVSAYAAGAQNVPAVAVAPGWFQIGAFFLPKALRCRLEFIGAVSSSGLVGTARLYDPSSGVDAPVAGSDVTFTSTNTQRNLSSAFDLLGNRTYWILVQGVGAAGADKFVAVGTAALAGV